MSENVIIPFAIIVIVDYSGIPETIWIGVVKYTFNIYICYSLEKSF